MQNVIVIGNMRVVRVGDSFFLEKLTKDRLDADAWIKIYSLRLADAHNSPLTSGQLGGYDLARLLIAQFNSSVAYNEMQVKLLNDGAIRLTRKVTPIKRKRNTVEEDVDLHDICVETVHIDSLGDTCWRYLYGLTCQTLKGELISFSQSSQSFPIDIINALLQGLLEN